MVQRRFGVLPSFFCSARSAPGLIEELWGFAKSAYLDNPMPAVFKERLLVHLSRFCEIRYCIVRHVGFLTSRPAGDGNAIPQSVDDVIALLERPIPDATMLAAAFERLSCSMLTAIPVPDSQSEFDLFDALTVVFLEPAHSEPAREAIKSALGEGIFEGLTAFLAFVRTIHFWSETHPELEYETDVLDMMEARPDLATLLLDPADAEQVKGGRKLREVLDDLHRTQAALRESEKRFRALALAGSSSVFRLSADWNETLQLSDFDQHKNTESVSGEWLSNHVDVADHEAARIAIKEAIESKTTFELEHRVQRSDGSLGWGRSRVVPILKQTGEIAEWFGTTSDITQRKEVEAALVINDERLQMALSASGQVGLWDWMVDTDLLHGDANFARLYGLDVERTANGLTMEQYQEFVVHDDLFALRSKIQDVFERGADFFIDYRLAIPGQPLKWVECKGRMLHGADGKPVRFSGTAIDITERKAAVQQKHLLMQELSHRVNNTFAVVQAIAFQSLRGLDREVVSAFQSRLIALSRAHDVLLRTDWKPTTLQELFHSVLRLETEGKQFKVDGPEVKVGPQAALSLSLLLHELMTNATKYGALSVDDGHVNVIWELAGDTFRLHWREVGGPPAVAPDRKGFGSVLVERGVVGARDVQLTYGPGGFTAEFCAPRERLAQ